MTILTAQASKLTVWTVQPAASTVWTVKLAWHLESDDVAAWPGLSCADRHGWCPSPGREVSIGIWVGGAGSPRLGVKHRFQARGLSMRSIVRSRRLLSRWPEWAGYGAAGWSLLYGLLGLAWSLGVPGFPFGEGDVPDAREESLLGGVTAAAGAPVVAVVGFVGMLGGLLMVRGSRGRVALAVFGGVMAVLLLAVVQDARPLTVMAYTPAILVEAPFGWPPVPFGELVAKVFPWPTLNLFLCLVGGVLWVAATVAFLRRTRDDCGNCGRGDGAPATWTTPAAAARWGRWAAYTAAAVPFVYAVIRWAWVFHIPLTMSAAEVQELHDTGLVWAGAYLATFAACGGLLTLGLVHRWGEVWPRWVLGLAGKRVPPAFPITFASVVTLALVWSVGQFFRPSLWNSAMLTSPFTVFPLWAVGLGLATLAYYFRTRPACRVCGRESVWVGQLT